VMLQPQWPNTLPAEKISQCEFFAISTMNRSAQTDSKDAEMWNATATPRLAICRPQTETLERQAVAVIMAINSSAKAAYVCSKVPLVSSQKRNGNNAPRGGQSSNSGRPSDAGCQHWQQGILKGTGSRAEKRLNKLRPWPNAEESVHDAQKIRYEGAVSSRASRHPIWITEDVC